MAIGLVTSYLLVSSAPIQMLVLISRHKPGYPPGLPVRAQDAIAFAIAPTARIFGVHAYYPPRPPGGSAWPVADRSS